MKETTLKTRVLAAYRARGAWAVKIHGSPLQEAGIPDVLACYRGRLVAPELKAGSNEPSKIQLRQMQAIRTAGGVSAPVWSVEEALALLDQVDRALQQQAVAV